MCPVGQMSNIRQNDSERSARGAEESNTFLSAAVMSGPERGKSRFVTAAEGRERDAGGRKGGGLTLIPKWNNVIRQRNNETGLEGRREDQIGPNTYYSFLMTLRVSCQRTETTLLDVMQF